MNYEGEKFLLKLYKDMHLKQSVIHSSNVNDKKLEKIKKYLDRQESVHQKALEHGKLDLLKKAYFDKYVIKEIPKEYMDFLDKTTFDQIGHHLSEEGKEEHKRVIIEDQKKSLSSWIDYLTSEDARFYPWWAKYWAFQGMLKIGAYDNENNIYGKRDETTVAPFIELNQEALAKAIDLVIKEVSGEEIDEDLKQLISSGSFTKLYTIFSKENRKELYDNKEIDGIWIKYEQGDNYKPLLNSLQGYNTGWCTAGEATCKRQLENGDFYVYYTKDKNNEYKVPRLAIRMDGKDRIGEIRGVAKSQNVESHLEDILDKKLDEFSDKEDYKQRLNDSKMITYVYTKFEHNKELTIKDLRFIHEIDRKIESFGYETDPRITEIKNSRNRRKDLALIFDCKENEIATTKEELEQSDYIKVFDGDLDYYAYIKDVEDIKLPEIVLKSVHLYMLESTEGLTLPKQVKSLYLNSLTSADDLILPKEVKHLVLRSLTNAKGITFPEQVETLNLSSLTSAKGLTLPKKIENLDLDSLKNAEGLIFPEKVKRLYLKSLTNAEGLTLPKEVEILHLDCLTNTEGLKFPEKVKVLKLNSLTSAEELTLPKKVENLHLDSLINAEGVTFPKEVKYLHLVSLKSVEGITLPEKAEEIHLNNLRNAKGVTFPKEVGKLDLSSLTSAEELTLPKKVENLHLDSLINAEGVTFPKEVKYLHLVSLKSVEGITLPEKAEEIHLNNLRNAKGVTFPKEVKYLDLSSLTNATGITLPEKAEEIHLNSLTNATGITLPKEVDVLNLSSLTSAEGITFPENVEYLNLSSLTSTEGLTLPKQVKYLYLNSLRSAEGVTFPENVEYLNLSSLRSAEGVILPKKMFDLDLSGLESTEGLNLPEGIEFLFLSYSIRQELEERKKTRK